MHALQAQRADLVDPVGVHAQGAPAAGALPRAVPAREGGLPGGQCRRAAPVRGRAAQGGARFIRAAGHALALPGLRRHGDRLLRDIAPGHEEEEHLLFLS